MTYIPLNDYYLVTLIPEVKGSSENPVGKVNRYGDKYAFLWKA